MVYSNELVDDLDGSADTKIGWFLDSFQVAGHAPVRGTQTPTARFP
jgi:hypothetical protein